MGKTKKKTWALFSIRVQQVLHVSLRRLRLQLLHLQRARRLVALHQKHTLIEFSSNMDGHVMNLVANGKQKTSVSTKQWLIQGQWNHIIDFSSNLDGHVMNLVDLEFCHKVKAIGSDHRK